MALPSLHRLVHLRSVIRLAGRYLDREEDPWAYVDHPFPAESFGAGSVNPFSWYFEGESTVYVSGVDDVCQWLIGCEYVRDAELFRLPDFWQHPCTFEQLRRGDCEDHALWAWRKLAELGVPARLVAGHTRWEPGGPDRHGHVWVQLVRDGEELLFEAAAKRRDQMIRPLAEVRAWYTPHFSVSNDGFQVRAYGGWIVYSRMRRAGKKGRADPPVTDAAT